MKISRIEITADGSRMAHNFVGERLFHFFDVFGSSLSKTGKANSLGGSADHSVDLSARPRLARVESRFTPVTPKRVPDEERRFTLRLAVIHPLEEVNRLASTRRTAQL